jgi:hypothetical protein
VLSVQAKQFKEQIVAAITRELEVATELSSGDNNNQIRDGYQKGVKGNSFVYFFNELSGIPPEEGVKVNFKVGEKTVNGRYLGEANSQYQFEQSLLVFKSSSQISLTLTQLLGYI